MTPPESHSPRSALSRGLRLLRGMMVTAFVLVVIGTALIVGLGRLLSPYADHLRPQLAQWLTERTGQVVEIGRLEAVWGRVTPVLTIHDLSVGATPEDAISVSRLSVEFSLRDALGGERHPVWLVLGGLAVNLVEQPSGEWLPGLEGSEEQVRFDLARLDIGDVLLRDSTLSLQPLSGDVRRFNLPEVRLQVDGSLLWLAGDVRPLHAPRQRLAFRLRADLVESQPDAVDIWLRGQDLELSRWLLPESPERRALAEVSLSLEAWLAWRNDHSARLHGSLGLRRWPMGSGQQGRIDADFILARQRGSFQLDLPRIEMDDGDIRHQAQGISLAHAESHWALAAGELELSMAERLAMPWLPFDVQAESLSGTVRGLVLGGNREWGLHHAEGRIEALSLRLPHGLPTVDDLSLELGLEGDLLRVRPLPTMPRLAWPGMVSGDIRVDTVGGDVLLGPEYLFMRGLSLAHPELAVEGDGLISWARGEPYLDLVLDVPLIDTPDARPYLPYGIIPENVLTWLNRALVDGGRGRGRLQYAGYPRRWPWAPGEGRFEAHLDLLDGGLDFFPRWPRARDLRGRLTFLDRGMHGETTRGSIAGVPVARGRIDIEDLMAPMLDMAFDAPGIEAGNLLGFIRAAPIMDELDAVEALDWAGPLDLEVAVELPLGAQQPEEWRLQGRLALKELAVRHRDRLFELDGVAGDIEFDREHFGPAALQGRLNGAPVSVNAAGGIGGHSRFEVAGMLSPEALLPPAWRAAIGDELPARGTSHWQLVLERDAEGTVLNARSDLAGTALMLPEPLAKPAGESWPLFLSLAVQPTIDRLELTLWDRLDISLRQRAGRWHAGIGLGGEQAVVPRDEQFVIRGTLDELDVGAWSRLAALAAGADPVPPASGRMLLQVGRVRLGQRFLNDITATLRRDHPHWILDVLGAGASGQIRLPATPEAARLVVGDFQRLYLSEHQHDPDERKLPALPAPDPRRLPDLHLLVEDFRLGALPLGRARVEAHRTAGGLEVEMLQTGHELARLTGRGRWLQHGDDQSSDFELRLSTRDVEQLLRDTGFEPMVQQGRGQVELIGRWPGAPMDFDLAEFEGSLALRIEDGALPEARPGAGRVLGLVSLTALPRRLQLDFRDVFGRGLTFDALHGEFSLSGGVAVTPGLVIESPAADVRITGSTDLVARTYDQEILVRPGLGSTLPVIGALAGGPGGAAAGIALQGLLGSSLRDLGEHSYRVTGPWDDPVVEVSAGVAEPPAPLLPPAGDEARGNVPPTRPARDVGGRG